MKGMLDTHAFLWMDSEPAKLSAVAQAFILDPIFAKYSVQTLW